MNPCSKKKTGILQATFTQLTSTQLPDDELSALLPKLLELQGERHLFLSNRQGIQTSIIQQIDEINLHPSFFLPQPIPDAPISVFLASSVAILRNPSYAIERIPRTLQKKVSSFTDRFRALRKRNFRLSVTPTGEPISTIVAGATDEESLRGVYSPQLPANEQTTLSSGQEITITVPTTLEIIPAVPLNISGRFGTFHPFYYTVAADSIYCSTSPDGRNSGEELDNSNGTGREQQASTGTSAGSTTRSPNSTTLSASSHQLQTSINALPIMLSGSIRGNQTQQAPRPPPHRPSPPRQISPPQRAPLVQRQTPLRRQLPPVSHHRTKQQTSAQLAAWATTTRFTSHKRKSTFIREQSTWSG